MMPLLDSVQRRTFRYLGVWSSLSAGKGKKYFGDHINWERGR
jgi:hypothetical protein